MKNKLIRHLALAFIAFCVLDFFVQIELNRQYKTDQKLEISSQLSTLRAELEKEITANLLLVQGTANFISVTPKMTQEKFSTYAQNVFEGKNLLKNLGAAPDFIMRFIYPIEGNEAILGVNYRDLPNQWDQVRLAALNREMVVAGPLTLVQGGTGLIGRAPVFINQDGKKILWGIISSVIDADKLYQKAGLNSETIEIALRGVDGKGQLGAVFWGSPEMFGPKADTVTMPVMFPSGNWVIAGRPKNGWATLHPQSFAVHGLIVLTMLITMSFLYRSIKRNALIAQTRDSLNISQAIAHLGSWELTLSTGKIWWSDEVYRIYGFSPEEITPTLDLFFSMVHPDDLERVRAKYEESINSCNSHDIDHRIITKEGVTRHVQVRGTLQCNNKNTPVQFRGTVLDITDRVLAEEALKGNEEQLRAMSEASHDGLVMIDSDDHIMFWSQAAERIFGWSREEAIGQKLHHLIAPKYERDLAMEGLKHFSITGHGPVIGSVTEFMALKSDGNLIPVERSVSSFSLGGKFYAVGTLRDITERKKNERKLRAFSDRLSLASKAGQIGVWEWSVEGNELIWDDQMMNLYKVKPNEFTGNYEAWKNRIHPEDLAQIESVLQEAIQKEGTREWEFRIVWPDGEVRYIRAAAVIRKDDKSDSIHLTGVNWDVTESRTTQEKLRMLATIDSLTGLYNRRRFMELNEREYERCHRYPTPYSLIMFDVDKFKNINDTYGHDVGDIVLKAIAQKAQGALRDVDILGRIGGEEFAVGMPETTLEAGKLVAEKLRDIMEMTTVTLVDGRIIDFTVSLGLAELSDSCSSVDDLLKSADIALYRAKRNGRNRVEFVENSQSCVIKE